MENSERNPEEFHTLNKNSKKVLIALGVFFVLVILPIFALSYYRFALNRPAQGFKETTFTINEGEAVTSVAERLAEDELINSDFLFKAYLVSEGLHKKMEAGVYEIPAGASIKELSEIFQHGTNDIKVTFIEGWRVEQYATKLAEMYDGINYEEFVELAKPKEGYLFPDTYLFNIEVSEQDVLDRLLSTYKEKTKGVITDDALANLGMTEDQLITFASIVEREVSRDEDRKIVAGILINRWRAGLPLEADATTQYAVALDKFCEDKGTECPTEDQAAFVDWWPSELTVEDLDNESLYNTRANAGLPPAPIANPGLSAIVDVINYKDTTYNYYLTDKNGITHFSNTLDEHNRNVSEYLY